MSFNNDKIFVIITVAYELDASSVAHSLLYSRAVHGSHPCRAWSPLFNTENIGLSCVTHRRLWIGKCNKTDILAKNVLS